MFVQESATERADESLGVQFEWLDVTGMYPKYHRRVQISSLYSEEQRVCICFLLCSQSLFCVCVCVCDDDRPFIVLTETKFKMLLAVKPKVL